MLVMAQSIPEERSDSSMKKKKKTIGKGKLKEQIKSSRASHHHDICFQNKNTLILKLFESYENQFSTSSVGTCIHNFDCGIEWCVRRH